MFYFARNNYDKYNASKDWLMKHFLSGQLSLYCELSWKWVGNINHSLCGDWLQILYIDLFPKCQSFSNLKNKYHLIQLAYVLNLLMESIRICFLQESNYRKRNYFTYKVSSRNSFFLFFPCNNIFKLYISHWYFQKKMSSRQKQYILSP